MSDLEATSVLRPPRIRVLTATLAALLAGMLALLTALAGPAQAATWQLSGNLGAHDPTILHEGTTWWVATTGTGIPMKHSSDGHAWTQGTPIFRSELPWWRTYAPTMGTNDVWAPDMHTYNGRVWMYYSVSEFGKNQSAIGLTSAPSAASGSWRDDGVVISSAPNQQSYNAIDPDLTFDASGNPWLVFGSWFSGIYVTKIDPATMKPTGGLTKIAARSNGIEGANIVYAGGYYYLFASFDLCCQGVNSTYKIAYGRSTSLTGPYTDASGVQMLNGGGTVLESSHGNVIGPGGQSVIGNGSGWLIIRHYYDGDGNGTPTMEISDLYYSAGWPTYTPTSGGGATTGPLRAVGAGRCLDDPNGSTTQGTQMQIYDCNGLAPQSWTRTSSGTITVTNNGTTDCLDANGSGTTNGTKVIIWPCNGRANQQWTFNANGTITGNSSGLCLDATGHGTANGTLVELWACNDGSNQQWSMG